MTAWALTFVVWALLALSVAGLWVVAVTGTRLAGRLITRPGALMRGLLANRYARAAVLVAWMWLGWHLFAR